MTITEIVCEKYSFVILCINRIKGTNQSSPLSVSAVVTIFLAAIALSFVSRTRHQPHLIHNVPKLFS